MSQDGSGGERVKGFEPALRDGGDEAPPSIRFNPIRFPVLSFRCRRILNFIPPEPPQRFRQQCAAVFACEDTPVPMTNLYLSMLDRMGAPIERFGDSTGRFEAIA